MARANPFLREAIERGSVPNRVLFYFLISLLQGPQPFQSPCKSPRPSDMVGPRSRTRPVGVPARRSDKLHLIRWCKPWSVRAGNLSVSGLRRGD